MQKYEESQYEENTYEAKYTSAQVADAQVIVTNGQAQQQTQPQTQNVVIAVEYEPADTKPKILNPEAPQSGGATMSRQKRKLIATIGGISPQPTTAPYINYLTQTQQQAQLNQMSPSHISTIVVEDRSRVVQQAQPQQIQQVQTTVQQHTQVDQMEETKQEIDDIATPTKQIKLSTSTSGADSFEVFGMFVANELRGLSSKSLQKKLKRKILQVVVEITNLDSDENSDK